MSEAAEHFYWRVGGEERLRYLSPDEAQQFASDRRVPIVRDSFEELVLLPEPQSLRERRRGRSRRFDGDQFERDRTEMWWAKVAIGCFAISAVGFCVSVVAWIVAAMM